jgi:uncharacterized protein (DUF608 family)
MAASNRSEHKGSRTSREEQRSPRAEQTLTPAHGGATGEGAREQTLTPALCRPTGEGECCSGFERREFLRLTGAGVAALAAGLPSLAGPFSADEFERLVPSNKRLSPDWIKSLFARGTPTVCRGAELEKIGMPVGGICAGQLYLGGDGKLWLWDIFNLPPPPGYNSGAGPHYEHPLEPTAPLEQGFALRVTSRHGTQVRSLDRNGFKEISFHGQYPIGRVEYVDRDCPVAATLEAYSPFIPLDVEDSELPATVLEFTVRNTGSEAVTLALAGWLENAVCLSSGQPGLGQRRNRIVRSSGLLMLHSTAEAALEDERQPDRPDILFEDFEKDTYEGWTATGTAFGNGPLEQAKMPAYQGDVGAQGKRLVNTHNTRQGEDVARGDAHMGTLTSKPFALERHYITFLIGGGSHPGKTCLNVIVEGKVVASATGANENRLHPHSIDVRAWAGKSAQIQIVDSEAGGWGNIGIDDIVFSDRPRVKPARLFEQEDFGSMALALLAGGDDHWGSASLPDGPAIQSALAALDRPGEAVAAKAFGAKLRGALGRTWKLKPGQQARAVFVLAWHFPAVWRGGLEHVTGIKGLKRSYAKRFCSAGAVARYVKARYEGLSAQTRLWNRTWYDSTLPHWFLDRTFLNLSILATATCYHFDSGRFYGWEGAYCCAGTCAHVWQYAHGVARVFPQLERTTREMIDYGLAFHAETGAIDYRAEAHRRVATDGQAGTILRAYREHQMSADGAFLRALWPRIRKSIEFLIAEDANEDGMLEGEQYNTLDASWYGQIAWLSSLYLAALRAGAAMAREQGEEAFAARCETLAASGSRLIVERLFNGEYFIHRPDPRRPDTINTNTGCHIDQVYGESWAFQVGLPRVLPREAARSALEALWKYNFAPDVGPYRKNFRAIKGGRWYAMPGEGGLLMCTWPKGGAEQAAGKGEPGFVAYFNECMTGFEYQVAAHMIWEGQVEHGLAVTRMIHDRYHPSKRNPWNEVECGSHYARAMASYGVYVAACGFEYHGPRGHLGFAPRLSPEDFRAAFIGAEGWGTYRQQTRGQRWTFEVEVKWGRLRLRTLAFALPATSLAAPGRFSVRFAGRAVPATVKVDGLRAEITLGDEVVVRTAETLQVVAQ